MYLREDCQLDGEGIQCPECNLICKSQECLVAHNTERKVNAKGRGRPGYYPNFVVNVRDV